MLDNGILILCSLENVSEAGYMPQEKLIEKHRGFFEEQSIGLTRSYLAKGADEQVDMVVRIWNEGVRPRISDYAVLQNYDSQENEKGDQYRITLVQPTTNEDGLKCFDLTLERLGDNYDVNFE